MKNWKEKIQALRPCYPALRWLEQFDDAHEAWNECPRGDWMLWISAELKVDIRTLILAKALCAKTVIHLMKDHRSVNAVIAAEKFGRGEIDLIELEEYANAATAAASLAADATAAASLAADAAAYAADAAAASIAADAASYAAYAAAKKENQKQTADICREILTDEVFKKINQ